MSGWLFVDDTSPRLQYVGQWELTNGSAPQVDRDLGTTHLDDFDNSWIGKIWNGTVHKIDSGIIGSGAEVRFGFNGTAYAVIGSFLFTGKSPRGRIDCFLDGSSSSSSTQSSSSSTFSFPPSTSTSPPSTSNPTPSSTSISKSKSDSDHSSLNSTSWPDEETPGFLVGNNAFVCGSPRGSLSPGAHELVIQVGGMTNSTFFLDYVLYDPGADVGLGFDGGGPTSDTVVDSSGTGVDADDASQDDGGSYLLLGNPPQLGTLLDEASENHVTFSGGWTLDNDIASVLTRTPGASVSVRFNGTGIQLYGDLGEGSNISNIASYHIDDQPPQSLTLLPPNDGSKLFFYQQLFNISGLSSTEEHMLVLSHNGTKGGMALSLDYFVVERAAGFGEITPTSSPSSTSGSGRKDAVIGGTVGGMFLLLLVILGAIWWVKKRRAKKRRDEEAVFVSTPFIAEAQNRHDSGFDALTSVNPQNQSQRSLPSKSVGTITAGFKYEDSSFVSASTSYPSPMSPNPWPVSPQSSRDQESIGQIVALHHPFAFARANQMSEATRDMDGTVMSSNGTDDMRDSGWRMSTAKGSPVNQRQDDRSYGHGSYGMTPNTPRTVAPPQYSED
ncbi:hypothetical protein D9758_014971 [Tetrapyrgos nigripes]|uniref:Uncharacterized protein n=1 Tax=Tetrapyrgos nigripes TaxID=182062 RepID=A0A8H5FNE6_9AGAR|nr:hypothetical protein D9758_014971 [Tetrapyrgos nigripes]